MIFVILSYSHINPLSIVLCVVFVTTLLSSDNRSISASMDCCDLLDSGPARVEVRDEASMEDFNASKYLRRFCFKREQVSYVGAYLGR